MERVNKSYCIELLDKAKSTRNIIIGNYVENRRVDEKKIKEFEQLQKKMLITAVGAAKSTEELELCAAAIETIYCGDDIDVDEWAEQVRIKAYGLDWYLSKYFDSAEFKEFVNFTQKTQMVNPFEVLK